MTNLPDKLDLIDSGTTEGEFQAAVGALYDVVKESATLGPAQALTIASGVVVPTKGIITVDTESAASTDNLDLITPTSLGEKVLIVRSVSSARVVTLRHNQSGTGKLWLNGAANVDLTDPTFMIMFLWNNTTSRWEELARNWGVYAPASGDKAAIRTALGLVINTDVQAYDADTVKSDVVTNRTKTHYFGTATLTDGATINWDTDSAQSAKVTLGGNRTFAAPTNQKDGASYVLRVIQDGTGSRTITWNSVFKFPNGIAPVLSTSSGAVDTFLFQSDGTNMRLVGSTIVPTSGVAIGDSPTWTGTHTFSNNVTISNSAPKLILNDNPYGSNAELSLDSYFVKLEGQGSSYHQINFDANSNTELSVGHDVYGALAFTTSSGTNETLYLYNGYSGVEMFRADVTAFSGGSTGTAYILDISSNIAYFIEGIVYARRGNAPVNDCAAYRLQALYRNNSGTVSLIGTIKQDVIGESTSAWDATFAISGTNILLSVISSSGANVTFKGSFNCWRLT